MSIIIELTDVEKTFTCSECEANFTVHRVKTFSIGDSFIQCVFCGKALGAVCRKYNSIEAKSKITLRFK